MIEKYSSCTSLANTENKYIPAITTQTQISGRDQTEDSLPSHLLFILKECKYNVQQRHSTKQWRAAEQKRWSWRGGGGRLCTERRGLGLRVSQRPSNQTSAPGVSAPAKCLRLITVWLLLVRRPRAGLFWTEGGKFDLTGWSKDDLDNFAPQWWTMSEISAGYAWCCCKALFF